MNNQIAETLKRLLKADYLSRAGSELDFSIGSLQLSRVESWQKAVALRDTNAASDAFTEAANRLTRRLSAEFRNEYRRWNSIIKETTDLFDRELFAMIDRRIDAVDDLKAIESAQSVVKHWIRWDILHFVCEQEYSKFVAPEFYSCIVPVYEAGHFVCHWDEVWPNGRIWVY